jgi:hypothetical protein
MHIFQNSREAFYLGNLIIIVSKNIAAQKVEVWMPLKGMD